jgi:hypothetical protein
LAISSPKCVDGSPKEGFQPFELRAVRIQRTRLTYSATFTDAADARMFSELD